MSDFKEIKKIAVFGSGSGGNPKESLSEYTEKLKTADGWKRSADLDNLWLAAEAGRLIAEGGYQLVTGGYDSGTMGMANKSFRAFSRWYENPNEPIGIPLTDYYPDDTHVDAEIIRGVPDLPTRLKLLTAADAFFLLRGGKGTLDEITTVIDEEDILQDAAEVGTVKYHPKPIIVLDPTGRMSKKLSIMYREEAIKTFGTDSVFTRIYLFNSVWDYDFREGSPRAASITLKPNTRQAINNILGYYSGKLPAEAIANIPTLVSNIICNTSIRDDLKDVY